MVICQHAHIGRPRQSRKLCPSSHLHLAARDDRGAKSEKLRYSLGPSVWTSPGGVGSIQGSLVPLLEELAMRGVGSRDSGSIQKGRLRLLELSDVERLGVTIHTLLGVLRSNPGLEYLLLHAVELSASPDELIQYEPFILPNCNHSISVGFSLQRASHISSGRFNHPIAIIVAP